jgi:SAM-dependent methyltransferase
VIIGAPGASASLRRPPEGRRRKGSPIDEGGDRFDFEGFQPLWRRHSDAVNRRLLEGWLPSRSRAALKTDLFDEAVGTGLYRDLHRRCERVIGIDVDPAAVSVARNRHPEIEAMHADVCGLPFEAGEFDLVVSLSTLDHLQSFERVRVAIGELNRVLRPGGSLLLTLDNRANPVVAIRNALPLRWLRRLRLVPYPVGVACGPGRLGRLLAAGGFEIGERTAIMHAPRVAGVAGAAAVERWLGEPGERRLLRALDACEQLGRLPTRNLSGYFIAFRATKPAG